MNAGLTDQQIAICERETERVTAILDAAAIDIDLDGGDLRVFAMTLQIAAARMSASIVGERQTFDALLRQAHHLAKMEGVAGQC